MVASKRIRYPITARREKLPTFEIEDSGEVIDEINASTQDPENKEVVNQAPERAHEGLKLSPPAALPLDETIHFKIAVALAYVALNAALNMLNKWALGMFGFHFPLILTSFHMLFGSIALSPLMMIRRRYRDTLKEDFYGNWKGLLFLGCLNGPQIALNNASLVSIELSLNQVIRAGVPVGVACIALCIERRQPTLMGTSYLALITGSVMSVLLTGNAEGEAGGIILCCMSVIMQSLQMSLAGQLMTGRLDSFQMTFFCGPISTTVLLATEFILQKEVDEFLGFAHDHMKATVGILLGGCCIAVVYNVVLMQAVRSFSSVGTAVLGNSRTVLLIFMSSLILGELDGWSVQRWVGCIFTFIGSAGYGLHPQLGGSPMSRELSPEVCPACLPSALLDDELDERGDGGDDAPDSPRGTMTSPFVKLPQGDGEDLLAECATGSEEDGRQFQSDEQLKELPSATASLVDASGVEVISQSVPTAPLEDAHVVELTAQPALAPVMDVASLADATTMAEEKAQPAPASLEDGNSDASPSTAMPERGVPGEEMSEPSSQGDVNGNGAAPEVDPPPQDSPQPHNNEVAPQATPVSVGDQHAHEAR